MTKYKQLDSGILVQCDAKDYTLDGLVNVASGLGTSKSKRSHNKWQYEYTDWATLDAVYQSNWIARAIVDEPASAATREWRTIKAKRAEDIEAYEQMIDMRAEVEEALSWSRLYGGAGIVMITNQDLEQPLRLNAIKRGSLEKLLVFDRWDLTPEGNLNTWDMLADNYMRPEFFRVAGGSQRIHASHVAFFNGARLPKRQARINQGWGDSELRRCMEDINDTVGAKGGLAELLQEANIDVITREGLTEELTTDQDDAIMQRYELFSQMKSIINMALLDGTEKLDRQTLNLSGVSNLLETMMIWIAGAARMPMTEIFGTSAQGLNATGEGDRKQYYDKIAAMQSSDISRSIRKIDQVLVRSAIGSMPDDFDYVWNPLEQTDELQTSQAQLLQAQKTQIYFDLGAVQLSQVQRNLQSNEEYQFAEGVIEERETLEDNGLFDDPELDPSDEVDAMDSVHFMDSVLDELAEDVQDAEYEGKTVELNKPFRTPNEPKKFAVYVKNDKGNVVKVRFGDPDMSIKRDDLEARENFRSRHSCSEKKDKTSAGYWSCKFWSSKSVNCWMDKQKPLD